MATAQRARSARSGSRRNPACRGTIIAKAIDRGTVLKRWREQFSDITPIDELEPGEEASCVGVVSHMRLELGVCFQVTAEDGTGRVTAVWDRRADVSEIQLDDALHLTGTIEADDEGNVRIEHPRWEHVDPPYQ